MRSIVHEGEVAEKIFLHEKDAETYVNDEFQKIIKWKQQDKEWVTSHEMELEESYESNEN